MTDLGKMLLHACCGPCLVYPLEVLKSTGNISVDVYYYNPNIHPMTEYLRRMESLTAFCKKENVDFKIADYDPREYFSEINGKENDRCRLCYSLRLKATAEYGAVNGYELFSTTLSVSPYQNHEAIIEAGKEAQKAYGIEFVYYDFRDGFREGQNRAKEMGMHRQSYCGCLYSEMDRYNRKLDKAMKEAESK